MERRRKTSLIVGSAGLLSIVCLLFFSNTAQADITTGLIGWWKFDDGAGSVAVNSINSTKNGTLVNFPNDNSGWTASGYIGGALTFDGATSSRYISLPNAITLPAGNGFSLGFWAKKFSGQGDFLGGTSGQGGIKMYASLNTISVWSGNTGVLGTGSPSPITDPSQWHYFLITKSPTGLWKAYIDGVNVVNNSTIQPNDVAFTVLDFGRRAGGYFNGQLDDIRLYDRELSASDVSELFLYKYSAPNVSTNAISSGTSISAAFNGVILDDGGMTPSVRGFNYGLTSAYSDTVAENGSFSTGAFTSSIVSLLCGTSYHYRSFATNIVGTGYGEDATFTTSICETILPTVSIPFASSISTSTVVLNSSIDTLGDANASARGFEYGLSASYGSSVIVSGSYGVGSFSSSINGLSCSTLYHYHSLATNGAGTISSADQVFSTLACPGTVSSLTATSIADFNATLNANITSIGGADVTVRGFQYGTTTAYGLSVSASGKYGTGLYSQVVSNMECNTLYHWRAYITNSGSTVTSVDNTFTTSVCSDQFYVSPTGLSTNNGSIDYPWDLQTALSGGLGKILPGSTVWLRNGTYISPAQLNFGNVLTKKLFVSIVNGQKGLPITFRQFPGERATVDGGIESRGEWETFWGFEITNSDTNRRVCTSDRTGGINFYGRGGKAINMIIHDVGHPGIGFWNPVEDGGELYGNILWANGLYDTCNSPGTSSNPWTRGSGFYMQNTVGSRYIYDNISFWEFTTGMKAYGEDTSGFDFQGNVVFNNPTDNLFVTANGSSTKHLKIISNFTFQNTSTAPNNVVLGTYYPGVYDPGEDAVIQNNYLATGDIIPWGVNGVYPGAALRIADFSDINVTGNTFVGGIVADLLVTNRLTNLVWDNNTYYSTRIARPNFPFDYQSIPSALTTTFFASWKINCNCDGFSSYKTGLPTLNKVFVRPNSYESGRANIIIYNWQNKMTESVDVSNVLNPGDTYEVRDAQNYFGAPVAQGTYSGGNITLPLGGTGASVPVGTIVVEAKHTSLQFDTFVLIGGSAAKTANTVISYGANTGNSANSSVDISSSTAVVSSTLATTSSSSLPSASSIVIINKNFLATPSLSKASLVAVFVHALKFGSRGEEVKQLQKTLKYLGYFKFSKFTNVFGSITRAAVKAFQKGQHLKPISGFLDQNTRAALNKLYIKK